ncbi:hypothetical protein BsWGS_23810 [Bradybaena similaris]
MKTVCCVLLLGFLCLQAFGQVGRPSICNLPKAPGNCFAYNESYIFNTVKGACEKFIYGGCGGNENRFATIEECQAACAARLGTSINDRPGK